MARKKESGLVRDAREYARLDARLRKLRRDEDEVSEQLREIEERLAESFVAEGVGSVKVAGATVHVRREVWPALVVPEGVTRDDARAMAVHVLQSMGHGNMVTYNHQSVRGLLADLAVEEGDEIVVPEPLGTYIRAEVRHRIGVRRSR
jgi:hypothetical protein